eukprot:SAG31_NODE_4224_length_3447_cov_2.493130_5_plen_188_part_00
MFRDVSRWFETLRGGQPTAQPPSFSSRQRWLLGNGTAQPPERSTRGSTGGLALKGGGGYRGCLAPWLVGPLRCPCRPRRLRCSIGWSRRPAPASLARAHDRCQPNRAAARGSGRAIAVAVPVVGAARPRQIPRRSAPGRHSTLPQTCRGEVTQLGRTKIYHPACRVRVPVVNFILNRLVQERARLLA